MFFWLLLPGMTVDAEADISRFVNGHDRAEDDPIAGIYTGKRSGGIAVGSAAEYLGNSGIAF